MKLFQTLKSCWTAALTRVALFFSKTSLFTGRFASLLSEALSEHSTCSFQLWKAGCCFSLLEMGIPNSTPQIPSLQNAAEPAPRPKEHILRNLFPTSTFVFPDLKISTVYWLFMQINQVTDGPLLFRTAFPQPRCLDTKREQLKSRSESKLNPLHKNFKQEIKQSTSKPTQGWERKKIKINSGPASGCRKYFLVGARIAVNWIYCRNYSLSYSPLPQTERILLFLALPLPFYF